MSISSRYCFDGEHSPHHHHHHQPLPPPRGCKAIADGGYDITSQWKSLLGKGTRGFWYSTAAQGDCRNASGYLLIACTLLTDCMHFTH